MKLINLTCPHCQANLQANLDSGQRRAKCPYCDSEFIIDDEASHVRFDDMRSAGYDFERGRQQAQAEYTFTASPAPAKKKSNWWKWLLGFCFFPFVPAIAAMWGCYKLWTSRSAEEKESAGFIAGTCALLLGGLLFSGLLCYAVWGQNPDSVEVPVPEASETQPASDPFSSSSGLDSEVQPSQTVILKVGDLFSFGTYEQDNDSGNGPESITWRVLAISGSNVTLISQYGLDCLYWNYPHTKENEWQKSDIRAWLREAFVPEAFSTDERAAIVSVTLLTSREAERYFSTDFDRSCEPTAYAIARGVDTGRYGFCSWWLQDKGSTKYRVCIVDDEGSVRSALGYYTDEFGFAVRPVIEVDVSKLVIPANGN